MGAMQPSHWLILAIVVLILFGWKKLPDAARSLGKSLRIFKSEVKELQNDGKERPATPVSSERVAEPAEAPRPGPEPGHTDARSA
ncbi:Sec-independent protein translocase subunit TatA [Mycobacterium sp. MYCO198283]|uniref:Sec-independent protein translocase subunit TatA n=1 Tax=Mycobacterium sp. MYCO198283 TaxID=2883505 RepID=UPI001E558E5C|nr:Sec-independent protein translocase subunit TatA [Mycobacterium sp. MYCO198283]MCG5433402.1 Sec-independent protein translocase subunit TatA [Mycobacterium sp. MYCO198283]